MTSNADLALTCGFHGGAKGIRTPEPHTRGTGGINDLIEHRGLSGSRNPAA